MGAFADAAAYNAAHPITDPGTLSDYLKNNQGKTQSDYGDAIGQFYGANPGSLEDYLAANTGELAPWTGLDPFTEKQQATAQYNSLLDRYNQGQSAIAAAAPQAGQSYTADQITQMTGSPINNFSSYQGVPVATASNPFAPAGEQGWGGYYQFIQNPDGTYRTANLGGLNPDVRVNAPKGTGWDDYMNMAITAAVVAGNAYIAPEVIGAALAPAEGAALAGPTYAELGYTGLPEGAAGPTYGEMGYTGLNNQQAISAADAASNAARIRETLNTADSAKKVYNLGQTLSQLLSGGGATGGSKATISGQNSGQQIADYLRNLSAPVQTNDYLGQIKMNQNPFLFTSPGQTQASQGMYDVSGSNLANALRKK